MTLSRQELWKLSLNDRVDIFNEQNKTWQIGFVSDVYHDIETSEIKIVYLGWNAQYGDWIDIQTDSNKIAPLHTHTTPCIFNAVPHKLSSFKASYCNIVYDGNIVFVSTCTDDSKLLRIGKYDIKADQYNFFTQEFDFGLDTIDFMAIDAKNDVLMILAAIVYDGDDHNELFLSIDLKAESIKKDVRFQSWLEYRLTHCYVYNHELNCLYLLSSDDWYNMHHVKYCDKQNKLIELDTIIDDVIGYDGPEYQYFIDSEQDGKYLYGISDNYDQLTFKQWNELRIFEKTMDSIMKTKFAAIQFPAEIAEKNGYGIHAYKYLIILYFPHDCKGYFWCLDLRNRKWYKSKLRSPYLNAPHIFNGMDNYLYIMQLYQENGHYNIKYNLLDIIPQELHGNNMQENMMLIHGFMNEIGKKNDLLCPNSLINIVCMYYPQFLYF